MTHPSELPCIDPDCREGRGFILCQRCSARIERATTQHRLRYQRQRLPGVDS